MHLVIIAGTHYGVMLLRCYCMSALAGNVTLFWHLKILSGIFLLTLLQCMCVFFDRARQRVVYWIGMLLASVLAFHGA